jgi:hypothetical protein
MSEEERAQLTVHLAEYNRITWDNNTRFQRQQQQMNAIILLSSGIAAAFAAALQHAPGILLRSPRILCTDSSSVHTHNYSPRAR